MMGIDALAVAAAALIAPYAKTAAEALVKSLGESAAGAVGGLVTTVRERFRSKDDRKAEAALESATEQPEGSQELKALAKALDPYLKEDEVFRTKLGSLVATAGENEHLATVMNEATTTISGTQFATVVSGGSVGKIIQIETVGDGTTFN